MQCDVAVVGGGLAGLVCGVRAAITGRKVIVLEKSQDERYLCNSRMATGVFHVAYNPPSLNAAALRARARAALGASAREDLLAALCDNARRAVDWLGEVAR